MTPSQSILVGAILISVSLFVNNLIQPAKAAGGYGAFQLEHHSNTAANAGVFRLDTSSGEVSYCFLSGSTGVDLVCTKPVR